MILTLKNEDNVPSLKVPFLPENADSAQLN